MTECLQLPQKFTCRWASGRCVYDAEVRSGHVVVTWEGNTSGRPFTYTMEHFQRLVRGKDVIDIRSTEPPKLPTESMVDADQIVGYISATKIQAGTIKLDDITVRGGLTVPDLPGSDAAWAEQHKCSITYKPDGSVVFDAGWMRMELKKGANVCEAKRKMSKYLGRKP